VRAAAHALGALADVKAIPDLLDTLGRGGADSDAVRAALVTLTCQDFATSGRRWASWWAKHRDRPRAEWLLDALGSKNASLRKSAVEQLRQMSGEYFGYHHDLPKREREDARKKWMHWWGEVGRRRFVRHEDVGRGAAGGYAPMRDS